jgi:DNA-binding transcriptional MerR regulator
MSGWIKLHRKFIDWEWFNKSEAVHLFLYLVLKANHKDSFWQGHEVKRGQFITSFGKISTDTNISLQTIRTLLKKFENTNEINIQTTNKFTTITICKYDSYQTENEETNTQLTNKQQTTNNQLTTNKNDKNNKELLFTDFWKVYDKSVDRKKCLEKFIKLPEKDIELILEVLPIYITETKDKKFRKNPLTWLNGNCWLDIDKNYKPTATMFAHNEIID